MTAVFSRVAVLGLGLLGGSVALAARQRGAAASVSGWTRRPDVLREAGDRGVVDAAGATPEEAVRDADLVVLATPVYAMPETLRRAAPGLADGAIVTDVGSVKAQLAERLPGLIPPHATYVGSHPMAGSHERGLSHARADLFSGAPCVVMEHAVASAQERVAAFWSALGARVVLRDPDGHDAEVAWMSHLPHALAFAFAAALDSAPEGAHEVAGSGFRDFTRIARSEPELWSDILCANHKALVAPLEAARRALDLLSSAIEANDSDAVERFISASRSALSAASREGREASNPEREPEHPGGGLRDGRTNNHS